MNRTTVTLAGATVSSSFKSVRKRIGALAMVQRSRCDRKSDFANLKIESSLGVEGKVIAETSSNVIATKYLLTRTGNIKTNKQKRCTASLV